MRRVTTQGRIVQDVPNIGVTLVNTSVEKRSQFNSPFVKCQQLSVLPSRWTSRGGSDFALKRGVDNSEPTVYLRHRRRQKRVGLNKILPIRSRLGDLLGRATC